MSIRDIAVAGNFKVKCKKLQEVEKYQELLVEISRNWEMKENVASIVIWFKVTADCLKTKTVV